MENKNYSAGYKTMGKIIEFIDEISEFSKETPLELLEVVVLIHMSLIANGMSDLFKQKECLNQADQILRKLNTMADPAISNLLGIVNYEIANKACEMNFKSNLVHAVRFLRFALFGPGQAVDKDALSNYNNFSWNNIALGCYFIGKLTRNDDISDECFKMCNAAAKLVNNTKLLTELSLDMTQENELELIMSGNFRNPNMKSVNNISVTNIDNNEKNAPIVHNTSPSSNQESSTSESLVFQPRLVSPLKSGLQSKKSDGSLSELCLSPHLRPRSGSKASRSFCKLKLNKKSVAFEEQPIEFKDEDDGDENDDEDDDDDDDEDWDKEFGFETKLEVNEISTQNHKQLLKIKDVSAYKISEKSSLRSMQVVTYPTPSKLYSLKIRACTNVINSVGMDSFQPQDFEHWLQTLVEVHYQEKRIFPVSTPTNKVHDETKALKERFTKEKGYTLESILRVVTWCRFLAMKGESELCWNLLDALFAKFESFVATTVNMSSESKATRQMQRVFFDVSWEALLISIRVWSLKNKEQLTRMVGIAKSLYPAYSSIIDIVQCELVCSDLMTRTREEINQLEEESNGQNIPDIMAIYTEIYEKEKASLKVTQSKGPLFSLGCVLSDLYLVSSSIPPLLFSRAPAKYFDAPEILTGILHSDKAEKTAKKMKILTQEQQIQAIQEIYPQIPCSPTKAKMAFVMGHYAASCNNNALAESLLFESIYIFETFTNGTPPLLSDLGLRALQLFAETLKANHKLVYAKAAYSSATLLCSLQDKKEYFSVAKDYAEVARESNDTDECIRVYEEVIRKYTAKKKLWEVVYVKNVIADLNIERGNFLEAEKALQDSIAIIDNFMAGNQSSQVWDVRLKLASVYLYGYTSDRGIKYLEGILKNAPESVLRQKGPAIWSLLAVGYARSEQVPETIHALVKSLPPDTNLVHKKDSREIILKRYKKQFIDAAFTLICLYKNVKKPFEGFTICDMALELCDPVSDTLTIAKLYRRRADALSLAYDRSDILTFPTTLRAEIPGSPLPEPSESQTFMRPTDIFLEAAASYIRANSIYSSMGHTSGVSSTLSHLSLLYVNRLLLPATIFHEPLQKLLRMPYYKTRACDLRYKEERGEYVLSLEEIEHISAKALNTSMDILSLTKFPECMINAAELKLLQGDQPTALSFWKECKDIIWGVFIDGTSLFIGTWPYRDLLKVTSIIERLTRFVICIGDDFISRNFLMIDAYIKSRNTLSDARNASSSRYGEARPDYTNIDKDLLKLKFEYNAPASGNTAAPQSSRTSSSSSNITSPPASPNFGCISSANNKNKNPDISPCGNFDYVDESNVQNDAYNSVSEFLWCKFVYIRNQMHKLNSESACKEVLIMNMKKALFECLSASSDLRVGVGYESSMNPGCRCSPSCEESGPMEDVAINHRIRFDAFSSKFPNVAQKIVYAVNFSSVIMFYSPWAQMSYFISLKSDKSSNHFTAKSSTKSGCVEIRLCFLSNNDEYAIMKVSQDITLEDLVAEICKMHNSGLFSSLSSYSKGSSSRKFRCSFVTKNFAKELNLLSEKLYIEFLSRSSSSPGKVNLPSLSSSSSSSSSHKSYRLRERQLLFAIKSRSSEAGGFTSLTRSYRTTTVEDVLRDNEIIDPQPTMYLYGSTTQEQYTPYAKEFKYVSKGTVEYLSSLVFGSEDPSNVFTGFSITEPHSKSSSTSIPPPTVSSSSSLPPSIPKQSETLKDTQRDASIDELSLLFSGFLDLIPLKNRSRKKTRSKTTIETLLLEEAKVYSEDGTTKKTKESLHKRSSSTTDARYKSASPTRSVRSNSKSGANEERKSSILSISRSPIVVICTRELQAIPWEIVIPSFPVLRYFSFTDLVLAANKTSWQTRVRFRPSFISICSKKDYDSDIVARENVRRKLIKGGIEYLFRHKFDPPTYSSKVPLPPFFTYPVPNKKTKLFYLKHREMTFVSLSDLEKTPGAFTKLIVNNFTDSYPVIFITFADLVSSNPLLTEVLKRRASCTIIAVPQDGLAYVIDSIYHLHKPMCEIASTHRGKYLRNRYQFLLSIIDLVMKRTSIPIAVINSPFPV